MKSFCLRAAFIGFVLVSSVSISHAQYFSKNGYDLPTEGVVRVLVVYAQFDYSTSGCSDRNPNDPRSRRFVLTGEPINTQGL